MRIVVGLVWLSARRILRDMAVLYRLETGTQAQVVALPVPAREPLRLGPDGHPARGAWAASIVPHLRGGSRRAGFALVAWPDAPRVAIGARRVVGVAPLRHSDHVFVGACELLFSTDGLPVRVADGGSQSCAVCLEGNRDGEATLFECPRCGLRACGGCWSGFRHGRCTTTGCGQPAALERELWTPRPAEFVTAMPEAREAGR